MLAAAQIGALELHIWGSHGDAIQRPDRLVFDLDPDEGLLRRGPRGGVRGQGAARGAGTCSFAMLTGGKGIHVVAPIAPDRDSAGRRGFRQGRGAAAGRRRPDRYTANLRKAARDGRISSTGCATSAEHRHRPLVDPGQAQRDGGIPVSWDELRRARRADPVTVRPPAAASPPTRGPAILTCGRQFRGDAAEMLDGSHTID